MNKGITPQKGEVIKGDPDIFIGKLHFNDGKVIELSPSDIVVFTGPNNVGKSQVLKDVLCFYQGNKDEHLIVQDLEFSQMGYPHQEFLKTNFRRRNDGFQFEGLFFSSAEDFEHYWNKKKFSFIAKPFIEFLSTETRLALANTTASINPLTDIAIHPLHHLYSRDSLEKELSVLVNKAFGEHLCLNRGLGSKVALHVGQEVDPESGEDRVSEGFLKRLSEIPLVDKQGDGIRSFIGILLHLLTSNKSVSLIDEPESFLHPPQARVLGEMIAEQNKKQLLVCTHSEDFLKGLIERGENRVKVIRITREGSINPLSVLESNQIQTIWRDPILKFSNVLSGLFHQKVIICEADTDCRFYQAIMNAIVEENDFVQPDVLFTFSGGKDRLKVVVSALRPLNVKVSVVADMDILDEKNKFKALTESLGIMWVDVEEKWRTIFDYVRSQRPQLETEDVKKEIYSILDVVSEKQIPKQVLEQIQRVLKQSSAWGKVKDAGKAFFSNIVYRAFVELDSKCRQYGLFIVPEGQLESFYRPFSSASKHGTAWVNDVLEQVDLINDEELQSARQFVKDVVSY